MDAVHDWERKISIDSCVCRGWVAVEDIPFETVAYEPLMVTPYGLCISFPDCDAAIKKLLKHRNHPISEQFQVFITACHSNRKACKTDHW